MLTTEDEDRIEAALPSMIDVEYEGANDENPQTYSYELTPYWGGSDAEGDDVATSPEYPALALDWDTQGEPDDERQPADDVRDAYPRGVNEYVEEHVACLFDDLSLTVAVKATHDANGVPPQVRASQISRELWEFLWFDIDLNQRGENGERPLVVEVPNGPPGRERVANTLRAEIPVRLRYTIEKDVVRNTASDAEYDVNTT